MGSLSTTVLDQYNTSVARIGRNATLIKWAAGAGLVALLGMALPLIAAGTLSLVLVVVTGVAGVAVANWWPSYVIKMKNKKLEWQLNEAKKNPIFTALNIYLKREEDLERNREYISRVITAETTAESRTIVHQQKFPNDPALPRMLQEVQMGKRNIEILKEKRKGAQRAQDTLKQTIDQMQSRYEVALERLAANKAMNQANKDAVFENLMLETSFNEVMRTSNESFAELMMADMDHPGSVEPEIRQLTQDEVQVIQMSPTHPNIVALNRVVDKEKIAS